MKLYHIAVDRTFSAAHALRGYKGKCERLHGHTWKVQVIVTGERLNKLGMLVDFTELKQITDAVIARLDHQYVNKVPPFTKINPTAENLAFYLYGRLERLLSPVLRDGAKLASVKVWESETSSALVSEQ